MALIDGVEELTTGVLRVVAPKLLVFDSTPFALHALMRYAAPYRVLKCVLLAPLARQIGIVEV
ncbi:hypothetical protein F443_08841 [Phytophthora nicotianae P1569]|uniref:Uncharacterized protein n=2 Tax=Phytophthora nicotianae TaxID=4792 RepID=V9F5P8_PHYNI|nr:hypothetical protein F443_08841 [Phytophthora nicotianae P1569]ETO69935.1 hypothetical protein F444_13550 [Phytophthora nicotianae P1976]